MMMIIIIIIMSILSLSFHCNSEIRENGATTLDLQLKH
jgi:hypothetical protein